MTRTITEIHVYTTEDLVEMAKMYATLDIVGSLYRGSFERQDFEWAPDGNLIIKTMHTPESED